MADTAAQREARRQKILRNQEERMNRLLGKYAEAETNVKQSTPEKIQQKDEHESLSPHQSPYNLRQRSQKNSTVPPKSSNSQNELSAQHGAVPSSSATISQETSIPSNGNETDEISRKENKSEPTIGRIGDSVPFGHSQKPVESDQTSNGLPFDLQRLDPQTLEVLKIVMFVLTALFQRYLLKFGFGIFIFPSIFLPFIVLELAIKYSVHTYLKHIPLSHGKGNLLSAALMLCGIRQDIMDSYHLIMAHIASAASDFCVYFFAFIIGHAWMT
ncbi:unnamed protein product [Lymnaea stagnalis]|uniref:Calcium signal-modulating cyclophilin ligand n=1 Tax=Lymnaea stagnalis TaxID=6523 RepID=A0AAV2IC49_LYMST